MCYNFILFLWWCSCHRTLRLLLLLVSRLFGKLWLWVCFLNFILLEFDFHLWEIIEYFFVLVRFISISIHSVIFIYIQLSLRELGVHGHAFFFIHYFQSHWIEAGLFMDKNILMWKLFLIVPNKYCLCQSLNADWLFFKKESNSCSSVTNFIGHNIKHRFGWHH